MKLKPAQLETHLKKQGLAHFYLLTGDEPLQLMECADLLRHFAYAQGFNERVVLTVDAHFDWNDLDARTSNLSLFSRKQLLEIRLGDKTPGNEGTKVLLPYIENPSRDNLFVVTADKLDSAKQKAKWFTTLEQHGIIIQVYPIDTAQLPQWIVQRAANFKLKLSPEAINIIVERSEGHLLACSQEIEKLHLLYGSGEISEEQVLEAVADSARFEVFDWVDAILEGDALRSIRSLQRLREEGNEPVLIIWALNREVRNLCQIAYALRSGQPSEHVFKNYHVWQQRKPLIMKVIKRHNSPTSWQEFLQETVRIERIVKGMERGNAWDEILRLSLRIAGLNLFAE